MKTIKRLPEANKELKAVPAAPRARIDIAIRKLRKGLGRVESVGDRVSELKIDFQKGWRVYFTRRGEEIIVLLAVGSKRDQQRDIKKAKQREESVE